jgi:hypothetical protein
MIVCVMLTNSERARLVRAELETIAAALQLEELAELLVIGRKLLEQSGSDVADEERDQPQYD